MEIGDRVIYYTHEASDTAHTTVDQLAFVLGIIDDHTLDLVVFPAGGPVIFTRAVDFQPDGHNDVVGLSYWRAIGDDPPDFEEEMGHVNDPRWADLVRRQEREYDQAQARHRDAVSSRHEEERKELRQQINDERAK